MMKRGRVNPGWIQTWIFRPPRRSSSWSPGPMGGLLLGWPEDWKLKLEPDQVGMVVLDRHDQTSPVPECAPSDHHHLVHTHTTTYPHPHTPPKLLSTLITYSRLRGLLLSDIICRRSNCTLLMLFDSGRGGVRVGHPWLCLVFYCTLLTTNPKSVFYFILNLKVGEKGLESKILTHSYYSFVSFSFYYFLPFFSFLAHPKKCSTEKTDKLWKWQVVMKQTNRSTPKYRS